MNLETVAVDEVERYRGSFRFGVDEHGSWAADVVYERLDDDGQWDDMGSGGCHGDGWVVPLRRPELRAGDVLRIIGSGGMDVFDPVGDDELQRPMRVVYGFAAASVAALEVSGPAARRSIAVPSPVGGLAVVLLGAGEWTITPGLVDGTTGLAKVILLP